MPKESEGTGNSPQSIPKLENLKHSEFLPAKFDGTQLDNTQAHILSFEDYCEIHNIKDDAKLIARFRTTLSGQARLWIQNVKVSTWSDLKSKFTNRFSDVQTREAALGAFRNCIHRSGESVDTYLSRLRRFSDRLNYADENMVLDQFLNGLPVDAKISVRMARPKNLDDAAGLAQQYLDLQKTSVREVTFSCQNEPNDALQATIQNLTEEVARLKMERDTKYVSNRPTERRNSIEREPRSSRDSSSDSRRERSRERNDRRYRDDTPYRNNAGRPSSRGRGRNRGGGNRGNRRNQSRGRGRCFYCSSTEHYIGSCPKKMYDSYFQLCNFQGNVPSSMPLQGAPNNFQQFGYPSAQQDNRTDSNPHF